MLSETLQLQIPVPDGQTGEVSSSFWQSVLKWFDYVSAK